MRPRPFASGETVSQPDSTRSGSRETEPQPESIEVTVLERGSEAVVTVRGEIDAATADRVWQGVEKASAQAARVVLDLSGTTFIDSSGIAVFIKAQQVLGPRPGGLTLRGPSPSVRRLLTMTGLDVILTIESGPPAPDLPDAKP